MQPNMQPKQKRTKAFQVALRLAMTGELVCSLDTDRGKVWRVGGDRLHPATAAALLRAKHIAHVPAVVKEGHFFALTATGHSHVFTVVSMERFSPLFGSYAPRHARNRLRRRWRP